MAGRDVNININGKDNFSQAANAAGRSATNLKSVLGSVGSASGVGGLLSVAGIGAMTVGSIKLAASYEQTNVAFKTMLKSGSMATDLLGKLSAFAAETPFQFTELTDASKKLLAFGVSADQVVPTLRRLGDVSAGIGAPIGEIAELYGKARVQGRLFAEDVNQFTGRGIPLIQELARQFNTTDSEVKKLVESGQVGFKNLEQAFVSMTTGGSQFAGMMVEQSKTLVGQWSSLKDLIEQTGRELGTTFIPHLKEAVGALNDVLAWSKDPSGMNADLAARKPIPIGNMFGDIRTDATHNAMLDAREKLNAAKDRRQGMLDSGNRNTGPADKLIRWLEIEAERTEREHNQRLKQIENGLPAGERGLDAAIGLGKSLFMDGGLAAGAKGASKGLGGLFGMARDASGVGAKFLADARAKQLQANVDMREKIRKETMSPQEKFDAEMAKLRVNRDMLGDDLFNRKRRMLEDDLAATFGKNDPAKVEKFKQEQRGLAPLTEARFLTSAPGYAADPATRAAQETANTSKEQLVVLRAMERKLQRQTRLGVL